MKLWWPAALIIAGVVMGVLTHAQLSHLFSETMFGIFLPALIFEAAWGLNIAAVLKSWKAIGLLILPGVPLTALLVGLVVHELGGLALVSSFLLGAILSATDPIAVVAIFRRLDVPGRLVAIVEGEALFNDAVAVLVYQAVLAAIVSGATLHALPVVLRDALLGVVAALLIGFVVGAIGAVCLRMRVPLWVAKVATLIAAYGSYMLADRLGGSGIFAVIACGVAMRALERKEIGAHAAGEIERFWHVLSNVANAFLFFLIGTAVDAGTLPLLWRVGLAALVGVGAARLVLAYGVLGLLPRMQRSWKTVVRLAGIRGPLSLALALALPVGLPFRDALVSATFVVVVAGLVAGFLTLEGRVDRALS